VKKRSVLSLESFKDRFISKLYQYDYFEQTYRVETCQTVKVQETYKNIHENN